MSNRDDYELSEALILSYGPKVIISNLWKIITSDFKTGLHLFIMGVFKTEYHEEGLKIFKYYGDCYWRDLSIDILAELVTVFVDEPKFEAEYKKLCLRIRQLINLKQKLNYQPPRIINLQ